MGPQHTTFTKYKMKDQIVNAMRATTSRRMKKKIEIRFDRKVSTNWNVIWNLCFYRNTPTLVCECVLCGARIWNIVNKKTSSQKKTIYSFSIIFSFFFLTSLRWMYRICGATGFSHICIYIYFHSIKPNVWRGKHFIVLFCHHSLIQHLIRTFICINFFVLFLL